MPETSRSPADPLHPAPVRAMVLGRYAGVVSVLAGMLRADGVEVVGTWAADDASGPASDPPPASTSAPAPGTADLPEGVVGVVTVGPGDDTLAHLQARGAARGRRPALVAVAWHPPRELAPEARALPLVTAGRIAADLSAAVRAAAGGYATDRRPRQP